jgi:YebC/PmpR family DNA-binding regulatory protein
MRCTTVFEQKDTLPSAELKGTMGHGNHFAGARQHHAQMGGHVIRTFGGMHKVLLALRREAFEEFVQIRPRGWISVFINNETRAGVLHENRSRPGAEATFPQDLGNDVCDFVSSLATSLNGERGGFGDHRIIPARCRPDGKCCLRLTECPAILVQLMGRQWLLAKRQVNAKRKSAATGKLVKEISVAAKMGGPDPDGNARLFAAIEKARRESVSRDVIERAIKKGAGLGDEKMVMEEVTFEGYAPHKVPVIVEVLTDNNNRTAPELRVLFKKGQLGSPGSNKFLFDYVGLVEAHHAPDGVDPEEAAIEAGAQNFEPLSHEQNDDIPQDRTGVRFITERTDLHAVSKWLSGNGWTIITSELGYLPKSFPELTEEQMTEVGEFLESLDEHDDVHRVWAAVK